MFAEAVVRERDWLGLGLEVVYVGIRLVGNTEHNSTAVSGVVITSELGIVEDECRQLKELDAASVWGDRCNVADSGFGRASVCCR